MLWARRVCMAFGVTAMVGCTVTTTPAIVPVVPDSRPPSQVLPSAPVHFELPNDAGLVARVWSRPEPRHIVLGVHGFNDYSKAFEPLAQHLSAELGATTYAYDQRGFGANPQPGIWAGSDVLLADLRHIAAQLRERHPGLPLTVVGESMGGALVLVAASESPGLEADNIILQAPAVWGAQSMPWYQRISLQLMNIVAPEMTFTGRGVQSFGITPTNDPETLRDIGRDPLFIKATRVSSLAGVTGLMGRAQNLSLPPPQRSLVLYGLRDRIIPRPPVCDWLNRPVWVDPPLSTLNFVIYPDGWHLLTRQLQSRPVLQDIRLWLDRIPLPNQLGPQQAKGVVCVR